MNITKQFDAEDIKCEPGSREITAIISTETPDRDNEVMIAKGLEKKQYNKNPVVLRDHDLTDPIGSSRWIKCVDNKIIAKLYISDKSQTARETFDLYQDGTLKAFSVGFLPIESSPPTAKELREHPDWENVRTVHRRWEIYEFSACAVPCNPDALALCVAKGYSPEILKSLGYEPPQDCWEYPEEQEEEIIDPLAELEKKLRYSYCRSWKEIEKEIRAKIIIPNTEELINRLKGKA